MSQRFRAFCVSFFAIFLVHVVDAGYFHILHPGLKFPDYFPIMFGIIFFAWKVIVKKPIRELMGEGCTKTTLLHQFKEGFFQGLLVTMVCLMGSLLTGQVTIDFNRELAINTCFQAFGYVFFVPISAFYEELHYRGLYLSAFRGVLPIFLTIFVSSLVFSVVHLPFLKEYSVWYPVNLFLLGIIWSILRARSDSIVPCIGFHSAWNVSLILFAPVFNQTSERYVECSSTSTILLALCLGVYGCRQLKK